jgi:hypothetical protein
VTDEFVEPVALDGAALIRHAMSRSSTSVRIVRQFSQRLPGGGVELTTMTRYRADFPPGRLDEQEVRNTLAEVLAVNGLCQLHVPRPGARHVTTSSTARGAEWGGDDPRPRRATCRATT